MNDVVICRQVFLSRFGKNFDCGIAAVYKPRAPVYLKSVVFAQRHLSPSHYFQFYVSIAQIFAM
jgi:hypothetical protein